MEKIVITTPQAAEGIRASHCQELFVESNDQDFADRIITQITDGPSFKGRCYCEKPYSGRLQLGERFWIK